MKGYWLFPALSVGICTVTIVFNNHWFIIGLFIWLLYLFIFKRLRKVPILISLIFFLFFYLYIPALDSTGQVKPPDKTSLTGDIIGQINEAPAKIDFVFREQQSQEKLLVTFFKDKNSEKTLLQYNEQLKHGATCTLTGRPELPDEHTNPGQFNYRDYLLSQGITYQLTLKSLEDVNCVGSSPLHHIYSIRTTLISYINDRVSSETAGWLNALVLGDDSFIDDDIIDLFRRWSLSHLLAISGLHIGLVVSLLYFILIKLSLFTKEKAQWIMIFFLPFYAFLAGGEPSVWRASTMVLLFLIVSKAKIRFSMTDTLSIVFILLILFDKYIVYHVGFQLSFIVTLGLLLSKRWLSYTNNSFFLVLQISFVSQMMILPLQLGYFSTFQPLSILLNVLVVPYFTLFVIPYMFLLLITSPFTLVTKTLDFIFKHVHDVFISLIQGIDQIAYFPYILGSLPLLVVVLYYGFFFTFMKRMQYGQLVRAFKYGCFIVLLMVCVALRPYVSPVGTVTMLDIGQGDSFVVELPYRKAVIFYDAGAKVSFDDREPTDKVYEQIIKPYLYSRGIQTVDAIFLSHEDMDHMGSVSFMVEDMRVKNIIMSAYYENPPETELTWQNSGAKIRRIKKDEQITIGGHPFYALAPGHNKGSSNANSLVLLTKFGGKRWIFTGDIGKKTEKEIIKEFPNLDVDVNQVGHHGSNTSTAESYIEQLGPAFSLISVGRNNSYGHPTREVLDTLKEAESVVLRTDKDGAVQFRFKKNKGTFYKYIP